MPAGYRNQPVSPSGALGSISRLQPLPPMIERIRLESWHEVVGNDLRHEFFSFLIVLSRNFVPVLVGWIVFIVEPKLMAVDDQIDVFGKPLDNPKHLR